MSFAISFAGTPEEAVAHLRDENTPIRKHGDELGRLTAEYLAAVANQVDDDRRIFLEANGHSDQWAGAQVSVRFHTTPAAPKVQ